jgi:hypothetical protein
MAKRTSALIGTALMLTVLIPLVLVQRTDEPERVGQLPGVDGYMQPHEVPFPDTDRMPLREAEAAAPFPIYRPTHPLASDDGIMAVWVQLPSSDDVASGQVALWYASGLEIHLTPVSPGDDHPLAADFPDELRVSYETIGTTEMRVIPPAVLAPGQPGSVALVEDGVFITLYGWAPDLSEDDLRAIALTLVSSGDP